MELKCWNSVKIGQLAPKLNNVWINVFASSETRHDLFRQELSA